MSSFYDYSFSKNSSDSVAMDEQKEKMVTIRRIFRIDPKVQKDLGHEEKTEESKDKPRTTAEDMAIYLGGFAMDLSPRHSKTSIEDCRAKDPRYCPYHGADYMTNVLDGEFKKAGIYAAGGVERLGQGKFKVQYSVPESKKAAANGIIDKFLASPGFIELNAEDKKDAELVDAIGDLGDDVGRGFRTDRGNDDFAMREEHLDMLEKDMNDGMEIDPSELYQLRKDHHELKKLGKAAWEAANEAGIDPKINSKASREWKDSNEKWQAYRAASQKFSDDYNYVRANADLSHVKTPEDCKELMGHLEKQITQVGDFVKAADEVEALKEKKGVKGKKGIPGMKEFNDARGKIRFAIDGLKAARKQVEDANESGDVKKMRAAAHSLEFVLNQVKDGKDAIAESLKQAESFKKYLEGLPDAGEGSGKPSEKVAEKAEPEAPKEEKKPESGEAKKANFDFKGISEYATKHGFIPKYVTEDHATLVNTEHKFSKFNLNAIAKDLSKAFNVKTYVDPFTGAILVHSKDSEPDGTDVTPKTFEDLSPKKQQTVANQIGYEAVEKFIGGTKLAGSTEIYIGKDYNPVNDGFQYSTFVKFPDHTPQKDVDDIAQSLFEKFHAECVDIGVYPTKAFKIIGYGKGYPSAAAIYIGAKDDSDSEGSPLPKADTPAKKYIESISKKPSSQTGPNAGTPPKKQGLMQILTKGKGASPKKD